MRFTPGAPYVEHLRTVRPVEASKSALWVGPIRGYAPHAARAQAADVWSCGVLLYIMIASAYPFGRPEDEPLAPAQKMQVMLQVCRHSLLV